MIGGGAVTDSATPGEQEINSSFASDGTGTGGFGTTAWTAFVDNLSGTNGFAVFVICAAAGAVDTGAAAVRIQGKSLVRRDVLTP